MAKRKQQLIHLHSTEPLTVERASGVTMAVGEIAVQAAADKKNSSLWILTANSGDVVQFPSVEKVNSLITDATDSDITTLKDDVKELKATVDGYSSTNKIQTAINGVKSELQGEIGTINGLIGSGVTGSDITTELAAVKNTANAASGKADANATAISTINTALGSLTGENAVPKAIDAAKTKVVAATGNATTDFLTVSDNSKTNPASGVTYTLTLTDVASASELSDLSKKVTTNETNITALKALHASGKTVAQEVADGIAGVVAGAPDKFDTLKEIADWIANDTTSSAQMVNDIADLKATLTGYTKTDTVQKAISTVNSNINTINSVLKGLSGESAVSNAINAAKTTITEGTFNGVKVEIDNTGIDDGHTNYKISGVGLATTGAVSDLSTKVGTLETSLANEVTARTEAVKTITDTIGNGFTSTDTVAKKVAAAKTKVARSTDTATTKFLTVSDNSETNPDSGVTYTLALNDVASAQALDTLDSNAAKSGKITVDSQEFKATNVDATNSLNFDLSNLVIDCGTY